MAQLQTYDLPDLVGLTPDPRDNGSTMRTHPGDPCTHKDDRSAYGIILSRRWGPGDKPMQCEVLWSKEPNPRPPIVINQHVLGSPHGRLDPNWQYLPREVVIEMINQLDTQIAEAILHGTVNSSHVHAIDPDVISVTISQSSNDPRIADCKIKRYSRNELESRMRDDYIIGVDGQTRRYRF